MDSYQIELVHESWAKVTPISAAAADLFYGRLFEVAPQVRGLFPTDMRSQKQKLMDMVAIAVVHADNLDALEDALRDSGARHKGYGAEPAHYEVVGECLIWTLEQGLGDEFTDEVKEAWATFYGEITKLMLEAT